MFQPGYPAHGSRTEQDSTSNQLCGITKSEAVFGALDVKADEESILDLEKRPDVLPRRRAPDQM